jgi:hypothetical protein
MAAIIDLAILKNLMGLQFHGQMKKKMLQREQEVFLLGETSRIGNV